MEKYLFDKFVASRFLGTRVNDPMVMRFMISVKKILNEIIAEFIIDYATVRGYTFKTVFDAYKEYRNIYGEESESIGKDPTNENEDVYKILLDNFFYSELEKRIYDYYKKMYDKYVPGLTEKAKKELDEYIKQKNQEREDYYDKLIQLMDEGLKKTRSLRKKAEEMIEVIRSKANAQESPIIGAKVEL